VYEGEVTELTPEDTENAVRVANLRIAFVEAHTEHRSSAMARWSATSSLG